MIYATTITSPIPPPPQQFSNAATLFTQSTPNVTNVSLFRNGVFQTLGQDYTLTGARITFTDPPQVDDVLTADVFTLQTVIDGAAPQTGTDQIKYREAAPIPHSNLYSGATIVGDLDGVNLIFGLAFGPTIFGTLDGVNAVFTTGVVMQRARVYRNGQLMTLDVDCSFYGNAVVFFGSQIPIPGDLILILGWI